MLVLELCLLSVLPFQEPGVAAQAPPAETSPRSGAQAEAPAADSPIATPPASPTPTDESPVAGEPATTNPTGTATTPTSNTNPRSWLPADTLLAVTLQLGDDCDLSGLRRQLRTMDRFGALDHFAAGLEQALQPIGLTTVEFHDIARHGIAFGLTGITPAATPEFVAVAHLGADPNLGPRIERAVTSELRAQGLHGGVFKGFLIVASNVDRIESTIAAMRPDANTRSANESANHQKRLHTNPIYHAACKDAPLDKEPDIELFVRPAALFAALSAVLPQQQRTGAERISNALAIADWERAVFRGNVDRDRLRFAGSCTIPAASKLMTALVGDPAAINEQLARVVPITATDFTFAASDFGTIAREVLGLVKAADPGAGMMAEMMIQQFGNQAEVDLTEDLFEGFSGSTVAFTLPSGTATLIGLEEPERFAAMIDKLLDAGQVPVKRATVDGATAYRIGGDAVPLKLSFATLGNWFCIAESDATLAAIASQLDRPAINRKAIAALKARLPGTTMIHGNPGTGSLATTHRRDGLAQWLGSFGLGRSIPIVQSRTTPASKEQVDALQQAESNPEATAVTELAELANAKHAGVAARATWLLRQREPADARKALEHLAVASPHNEVRVQAFHALLRVGNAATLPVAIEGLDDKDMRARTLAAQLLGRLKDPDSGNALLAMLATRAKVADPEDDSTDLQAALLALSDLGTPKLMLPVATALDGSRAQGFAEALTFYYQTHSPELEQEDEATLLLAVLGHSTQLLRRYAIGRLSELRDLSTVRALEGRLAVEGPELRPLIEVALNQIRRQPPAGSRPTDGSTANTEAAPWQQVVARWSALDPNQQILIGGLGGVFGIAFLTLIGVLVKRRRHRRSAQMASDLVAPSEDYLEQLEEESSALAEAADDLIDDASGLASETDDDGVWQDQDGEAVAVDVEDGWEETDNTDDPIYGDVGSEMADEVIEDPHRG
ncbi:MAG: HEAT repeat domain-containing protein [bacterium]|nr:HEAT repeat domain-containing protein [bacterium]